MEELIFKRDGKKIYGRLYMPDGNVSGDGVSIVIMCHGFGGNLGNLEDIAQSFAENGTAACVFDFIGGGLNIRSEGKTTEMSVLTEAADLEAVLAGITAHTRIDKERVFLMGESQGGFVASYVAGKSAGKFAEKGISIKGVIAFYPAYVLQNDAKKRTPDLALAPEVIEVMGVPLGKVYGRDAMSFDIYNVIKNYSGNVLIIHGTADSLVPVSYSEKAVKSFPSAELIKIEGAGHGFYGKDRAEAVAASIRFVKENL